MTIHAPLERVKQRNRGLTHPISAGMLILTYLSRERHLAWLGTMLSTCVGRRLRMSRRLRTRQRPRTSDASRHVTTRAFLRALVGVVLASCQRAAGGDDAARAQAAVAEFYAWYRPAAEGAEADMRANRRVRSMRQHLPLFEQTAARSAVTAASALRADQVALIARR
jgi:hypothetical protein